LKRNNSNDLDNYWISGFAEGDASFQIKVVNKANRIKPEIRLRFQADQKTNYILLLVPSTLHPFTPNPLFFPSPSGGFTYTLPAVIDHSCVSIEGGRERSVTPPRINLTAI
jgi:hypothetical protein